MACGDSLVCDGGCVVCSNGEWVEDESVYIDDSLTSNFLSLWRQHQMMVVMMMTMRMGSGRENCDRLY